MIGKKFEQYTQARIQAVSRQSCIFSKEDLTFLRGTFIFFRNNKDVTNYLKNLCKNARKGPQDYVISG